MSVFLDLIQIILIDLSLAADNAVIVGAAVGALPQDQHKGAMTAGIAAATVLRILMAFFASALLRVTGLLAAGGLLLLWVGWKMLRDLRGRKRDEEAAQPQKTFAAIRRIVVADVSMSLDNVLGVAGVARGHQVELAVGLGLSVVLMGLASAPIANLTARYPKIAYLGAAIVLYTAIVMIHDGVREMAAPIRALA